MPENIPVCLCIIDVGDAESDVGGGGTDPVSLVTALTLRHYSPHSQMSPGLPDTEAAARGHTGETVTHDDPPWSLDTHLTLETLGTGDQAGGCQ